MEGKEVLQVGRSPTCLSLGGLCEQVRFYSSAIQDSFSFSEIPIPLFKPLWGQALLRPRVRSTVYRAVRIYTALNLMT